MTGTMTMAQICAMWRNDARELRTQAGAAATQAGRFAKLARADEREKCARELALHLHTGGAGSHERTP